MNFTDVVFPFSAVVIAATAFYQSGKIAGRFEAHEKNAERRIGVLEADHRDRVTREELDARFAMVTNTQRETNTLLAEVLRKLAGRGPL